jgi:predicted NBD/HSP70 family sugar kinase
MLGSKPLKIEKSINFQDLLKDYFQVRFFLENDMNMAVNAELAIGFGKASKNFCLVIISTRIGIRIFVDGKIYNRKTEIGHCVIEKDRDRANPFQGYSGCWAAQKSGDGIKKTIEELGLEIAI